MNITSSNIKKKIAVKDIQENFKNAKAVILYNFSSVNNEKIFQLKRQLKEIGCLWKVYKNSLIEKAFLRYFLNLKLSQPNALIFCLEDEYKPLSILHQFNKENDDIKRFQDGIYEKKIVEGSLLER
jgi:large subunit ribosomal protein L10